ncbi:MAG: DUF5056 domain-containing protein [Prevotellaceae bacterium]|jgi:hypothetical protein|nr:DUF5056 domain-containing protein [Prevotellaceae bacterium]
MTYNGISAPNAGRWFKDHRQELADDGFTQKLMRRLPPKPSLLPQAAAALGMVGMGVAVFLALAATDAGAVVGSVRNFVAAASNSVIFLSSTLVATLDGFFHAVAAAPVAAATAASLSPQLAVVAVATLVEIAASALAIFIFHESAEAA